MQIFATFLPSGKSTRAFYTESIHGVRKADEVSNLNCKIPAEAIEISNEDYQAYLQEHDKWLRDHVTGLRVAAPPPPPSTNEQITAALTAAIQRHMESTSIGRGYDSVLSISSYDNDPNPRFAAEAAAFKTWRSAVWSYAITVLAECTAGTRPIPTEAALIASLPLIIWPE